MSNIEELLDKQQLIQDGMEQLLRNFKKDSAARKTPSYLKNRLKTLDDQWEEFRHNDTALCKFDVPDCDYFTGNYYKQVEDFYNEVRNLIEDTLKTSEKSPAFPVTNKPSTSQEQTEHIDKKTASNRSNSSRSEDMLRKQSSNFKAFSRTIEHLDLEQMTERWKLEDALKTLEARWKTIDKLHWEIDGELAIEDAQYEMAFEALFDKYTSWKKAIYNKMSSVSYREKSTPQMELPTFNGNQQQWSTFKDLFTEAIHLNAALSNAQKMQFLKSRVRGEPETLICHLPITSENYEICWNILNKRYTDRRKTFNTYLKTILNLPTPQFQTASGVKRVYDTANACLNAIIKLGVNISTWDPILTYHIEEKLDTATKNEYIDSLKDPKELPVLKDMLDFLETKLTELESRSKQSQDRPSEHQQLQRGGQTYNKFQRSYKAFPTNSKWSSRSNNSPTKVTNNFSNYVKCPLCNNAHGLFHCNEFIKLQLNEKNEVVSKHNVCKNCLYDHKGQKCMSRKRCLKCNAYHHTLLHDSSITNKNKANISNEKTSTSSGHVSMEDVSETLLANALIKVKANDGSEMVLRALVDQGSQISLITDNAAQMLELPRQRCKGVIFGVGARENNCKGALSITCTSLNNKYTFETEVFVMRHLINNLPNKSFAKPTNWEHLEGLQLADPGFNISKPIDILLGAEIYSKIILGGIIKGEESQPIAQQSQLGWLLCGEVQSVYQCNVVLNNLEDMNRFWAIEDVTEDSQMSTEDIKCLKQYQTETKRQEDGRYVVRLPLHEDIEQKLGESRTKAAAQLYQLEKKFEKCENIARNYKLFMSEYIELKHMQPCERNSTPQYYLPHHCVQRADSTTSALRVVYNGSAKSTSNHSLNDLMYRGPNFQADLMTIVLKWREYQIVLLADIEKMFRQIWIHEDDRKYQKILWRESPTQPMQEYTLSTVTYGTKAAPFLAMMTLKQLANDERNNYPEAAAILESSFYMDDLLYSIDDLETAVRIKTDLTNLLKSGGFNLRKWSSNNLDLLNQDTSNNQSNAYDFRHQESTKALGIRWNPADDNFTFQLPFDMKSTKTITKRHLLSEISKVFDPLGWLSPVTTKLKLIFQQVWREELKWDDEVPETINKQWLTIKSELAQISELRIPRWLQITKNAEIELHGYADASEKEYACVVYAKVKKNPNNIIIVAAKSRLVPAKKIITLPRLELCAALLLANLLKKIRECLNSNHNITIIGYSDSKATLAWLNGRHDRWKPFVSNRVKKITDIVPSKCWRYVKSTENPADWASRGITPSQLKEHQLWWSGPQWLPTYQPQENQETYETNEEVKKLQTNVTTKQQEYDVISDVLTRNSSLTRAINVIAWMLRALSRNKTRPNYLTLPEIKEARNKILKYVQLTSFGNDISALQENKQVDSKSKLLALNPYLDEQGLLRVGGRIQNANIDENQKHPLIIPHEGHFTELLINKAHEMTFHGGARMTSVGNRAVKKRIYNCIKCRRHNPIKQTQLMGNLPASRCNPTRPFYHTGTDYTGYVDIKTNKGRGVKTTKGYVAVFVCMVTKAVHLEIVSDLTSSAFLSALRRLAARRGTPAHMYSDNGTNFVGANKILQNEFINLKETLDNEFFTTITDMEIVWHFNAPSWPSAGGLWEAAVKSLKFHLRRVIGEQKLTYEEMSTLLAQLEACLNSRPLSTLTEDPEDLDYLTPSHFLSSGPNLTIYETEKDERTRWQLVQRIFRDIWRRWQAEYLIQLSTRGKWRQAKNNMKINDIVVVHDANLPAGRWALGRVMELHPGQDGYVRVVTVKQRMD